MHGGKQWAVFAAFIGVLALLYVWIMSVIGSLFGVGLEWVSGLLCLGVLAGVASMIRRDLRKPWVVKLGWVAVLVSAITAAVCLYGLTMTPFAHLKGTVVSRMSLGAAIDRYGVSVVSGMDLSLALPFLLSLAATGLGLATLAMDGRPLERILVMLGFAPRGFARAANGELADSGWLPVSDALEHSLKGGLVMGQIDVTLDRAFKRRKVHKIGEEPKAMNPLDEEQELAKKASKGCGSMAPIIMHKLEGHGMSIGSTRSGKGLTLIANLLAPLVDVDGTWGMPRWKRRWHRRTLRRKGVQAGWPGPILMIDPKGENVIVALWARLMLGRKVRLIDPFDAVGEFAKKPGFEYLGLVPKGSFNPLDVIPSEDDPRFTNLIESMMDPLIPSPNGDAGNAKHFLDGAKTISAGIIGWMCSMFPKGDPRRSLMLFNELIYSPLLDAMLTGEGFPEECYESEGKLKPEWAEWNLADPMWLERAGGLPVRASGKYLKAGAENERPGFISSIQNAVKWLNNPVMRKHVAVSTFDLDDWFRGTEDLFLTVPAGDIPGVEGYMRLWAAMPILLAPFKQSLIKERCLVVLDEAPLFGKLDAIIQAFGVMAGYNVSYWVITQTLSQLEKAYSKEDAKTLLGNAEFVQLLKVGQGDDSGQKWASEVLGATTKLLETRGTSSGTSGQDGQVFGGSNVGTSLNRNLQKVELMTPAEIGQMQDGDCIMLWNPSGKERKPFRMRAVRYFDHPFFKDLALPNPMRPGAEPPMPEVVADLEARLLETAEQERKVEIPKSLIPPELRGGFTKPDGKGGSAGGGAVAAPAVLDIDVPQFSGYDDEDEKDELFSDRTSNEHKHRADSASSDLDGIEKELGGGDTDYSGVGGDGYDDYADIIGAETTFVGTYHEEDDVPV